MKIAIFEWFKVLSRIVRDYDSARNILHGRCMAAEVRADEAMRRAEVSERVIREHTELSVDLAVGKQGYSTVIVTGCYNNKDYVRVFKVRHECLRDLVPHLRREERFAKPRFIDTPFPDMRAVVERDMFRG